ncbi:MAG: HAD family hydrolase [Phycisphaerales bacterium]|nr:HAD family hydrolase [Phycisphaerales bacterium]
MEPAVFLDRDNTLIANDGDLGDPAQVRLMDGVAEGLQRLRDAGYRLVVVTNQGGVARGRYTERDVDAVNQRIAQLVDETTGLAGVIDRFYYCPFHPEATLDEYRREHPWRKPSPGMLLQAAHDMSLDLASSWLVGDQARDIEAGQAAGCRTVLVRRANRETAPGGPAPTIEARSFAEVVHRILEGAPAAESERKGNDPATPASERGTSKRTLRARTTTAPRRRSGETKRSVDRDPKRDSPLRRAIQELTEEMRNDRQRRLEFTPLLMAASLAQLLALLLATLAVLQAADTEPYLKWMAGAIMVQLVAIMLVLMDPRA